MSPFAFVRGGKIRDIPELSRLASHGRRLDRTSKRRADLARTPHSPAGSIYCDDPLDLVAAHHACLAAKDAVAYGRAAIGLNLLVGVTPDLIREAGDLHDPENPNNKALIKHSIEWAESVFGEGSVFAWRLDLDETGGALVDLFLAPTRIARMNRDCEKTIISVHHMLEAVRIEYEEQKSFSALQTSWAIYAAAHLDARLRRGEPKMQTGRQHIHPDLYRETLAKAMADAQVQIEALEAELARLEQVTQAALQRAKQAEWEAEGERGALRAAIARNEVRVRKQASAAVQALALGVSALLDGRIAGLSYDPIDGTPEPIPGSWLDEPTWLNLLDALRPAWDGGLLAVLEDLLAARERVSGIEVQYQAVAPSTW